MPSIVSRRGLLAGIGGLAATAGAGLLGPDGLRPPQRLSAAVAADTWPREKHDPTRTGHQPEPGPRAPPSEAWRTEIGDAPAGPGLVVTDDAVLTGDRTATVALDPGDGSRRWRRAYRERRLLGAGEAESVQVGPVAVGGRVLTGASVTLYTHAADGVTDWAYRTNSSFSTVLAVGNTVFLTSLVGDADRLVALSLETGLPYWRRETVAVPVAFAPDAGSLLAIRSPAGADEGTLQALDPASGAVEWTDEPSARPAAGRAPLTVADGRVYAARGPVVALDAETGEETWRVDAAPAGFGSPAVAGDRLYLPVDGAVLALDTADGSRAFAGLLSGVREPPSVNRVILFSLVAAVLGFGLRPVVGPAVGDLRGSRYVALDAGLVWVGALLLAYAVAFGVDWSPVRERLPDALAGRRAE